MTDRVLWDAPPYAPWCLNRRIGLPWGVRGAGGWNCYGKNGATFLASRDDAESVIREAGHKPDQECKT